MSTNSSIGQAGDSSQLGFPIAPLRILFVDDDPDTRRVMVRLLRSQGYIAYSAGTCQAAVQTAQDAQLDLLITDYLLPDGDGLSVLQEINMSRPAMFPPMRAILVTGVDGPIPALDSASDHFAERLTKPMEFSAVLDAIRSVVESAYTGGGFTDMGKNRDMPGRDNGMAS